VNSWWPRAAGLAAFAGLAISALSGAAAATASATLTPSRLAADLVAATKIKRIPASLAPSPSTASRDKPIIATNGCNLGHAETRSRPCLYGDPTSHTYVVLFGDSHAAAWFPALELISRQQHWRLAVFTKDGCPPAEVNIAAWFRRGAPYSECTRWRNNAKAQIAALHPALVVVTTATYLEEPEARPERGVPDLYASIWEDGLGAIFRFMHRAARATVFISDVPTIKEWVPPCVSSHMSDVSACNTNRRVANLLWGVKAKEIEVARSTGVSPIDPRPWFCASRTCPVIVGHILLYRDNAHMTPQWSRFIAPVFASAIVPLVPPHPPNGSAETGRTRVGEYGPLGPLRREA